MLDYCKALPQHLLPQHMLSALMHKLARVEQPIVKNTLIRLAMRHYHIDMSTAQQADYRRYPHFNAFFTRALKPGARPLPDDPKVIVSPVDGTVSQAGDIAPDGLLFQAKGRHFSLEQLLGGKSQYAAWFNGGRFATLYLSPRDYHRIHCPMNASLQAMIHVPGRLFSVNPAATRVIAGLFARNERVIALFETDFGPMALIMVGAIFVSSIETVWAGEITPPSGSRIREWRYDGSLRFARGEEIGRFNMGSTVIVLVGSQAPAWSPRLHPGAAVLMGQRLGPA